MNGKGAREAVSVEQKLREFVERENLRYQSMVLPGGIVTPGHDRAYLDDIIFSDFEEGQTILDVGSFLGHFCLEALRRGAAGATGLDDSETSLRRARELAAILGLSPEYIQADFEHWDSGDAKFDVVLGLNVLHHMYDAVHALRKMMGLARRRVVLELARATWRPFKDPWHNAMTLALEPLPIIHLGTPKRLGGVSSRTFLFTPPAMKILFNTHSRIWEPVRITKSPFKGRFIVEARKRHIRHLVVVAGVTSSGKSVFARRLLEDGELRASTLVPDVDWLHYRAKDLDSMPLGTLDNVVLEMDLFGVVRSEVRTFEKNPLFEILSVADRLTVLTIIPPSGRFAEQMTDKEIERLRKKSGRPMTEALVGLYAGTGDPKPIKKLYQKWIAYCAQAQVEKIEHTLILNKWETYESKPSTQFNKVFDAIHG